MSKKAWIIFIVVITGLLVGLVVWSRSTTPQVNINNINANAIQPASSSDGNIADHVIGKTDSKVILIEYGDYQCPGCGAANPGIETVTNQYKDVITYIFRNFPLTTIHQNALAAAGAAEAAGLQGKYWEMHHLLYKSQADWENLSGTDRTNMFTSYAKSLGLNETQFQSDLSSSAISQKISFDEAIGQKVQVDSTPSLFLNGVKLSSNVISDIQQGSGNQLRDALDTQLKAAGVTPPARS